MSEYVTLADCPPGPFRTPDGILGFKTEYGSARVDENGAEMPGHLVRFAITNWPDAYVMESGECFWGGAKTDEERAALLVEPIDVVPRHQRKKVRHERWQAPDPAVAR